MSAELYYTAPSQSSFDDMKEAAVAIWETYEDPYRTEKINAIKDLENIKDNFMYMFAMFDWFNQMKVVRMVAESTNKDLRERLIAGGANSLELRLFPKDM